MGKNPVRSRVYSQRYGELTEIICHEYKNTLSWLYTQRQRLLTAIH